MRTTFILILVAMAVCAVCYACSGPSDAEIDRQQDASCQRWGAKLGSSDYIHCRAQLAFNAEIRGRAEDAQNAAGAAMVFSVVNSAATSARR